MGKKLSDNEIRHLAKLSKLTIDEKQAHELQVQFQETLETISQLDELDTTKVAPTSQVTGQVNVWREDILQPDRQFTQEQALSNAKQCYKGFFVVPAVINQ